MASPGRRRPSSNASLSALTTPSFSDMGAIFGKSCAFRFPLRPSCASIDLPVSFYCIAGDRILEFPDSIDSDSDLVAALERERIGGNDSGSGQQDASMRKNVVA